MKTKDLFAGIFVVGLLVTVSWFWLAPLGLVKAPELTVNTIKGQTLDLKQFRGKPLLITFWATTCPGCIKEMPHLIELYNEFSPQGFEIIGIAMSYDPPNHVVQLAKNRQIPYPIALDIDGHAARIFGNVSLTPTHFLISPDGIIVQHKIGEMNIPDLRTQIKSMLNPV